MTKGKGSRSRSRARIPSRPQGAQQTKLVAVPEVVESLLDVMVEGSEYASIVNMRLPDGFDVMEEVVKGVRELEAVRQRSCLVYVGKITDAKAELAGVVANDDVPFQEMVKNVPADQRQIDILLATNGGSGEQVTRFVDCLRPRFDEVHFLIPSSCMSAGTLFALSGERIYMNPHASLGPIDPQVPSASGRYVPAQALLVLVEQLRQQGEDAMSKGGSVPWSAVRLIDSLDKTELGAAITATQWSQDLAAQYLQNYKFKHWGMRSSSGQPVTQAYKAQRAAEIAQALVAHDRWKNHGHAISREVLWNEIKLQIDHPDAELERAITRMWSLLFWLFDKTAVQKLICSSHYRFVTHAVQQVVRVPK